MELSPPLPPRSIALQVQQGALYVLGFALAAPLAHILLGTVLDRHLPSPRLGLAPKLAGLGATAVGVATVVWAMVVLGRKGRGLPLSSSPPRRLVSVGPYRLSRHPIYAGAVLLFMGFALALGAFWTSAVAGPLLAAFYFTYARGVEEPVLAERFGNAYLEYRARTPFVFGFPFRRVVVRKIGLLLDSLSALINRPGIWRVWPHIFFWGYGVWPGIGVGLGLCVTGFALATAGLSPAAISLSTAVMTVAGLAGTRLVWRLASVLGRTRSLRESAQLVGFVSWGAIAGMLVAAPLLGFVVRDSPLVFLDASFMGLMITHVFGRIGCAFYGCCHGRETKGSLRLRYFHPALKAVREGRIDASSLLPVPLLSTLWGAGVAALVLWNYTAKTLPAGAPAFLTAALYGFCRFDEEWLRLPPVGFEKLVSPAQFAAVSIAVSGLCGALVVSVTSAGLPPESQRVVAPFTGDLASVPVAAAFLTFLVFSYHRGTIGRW